MKSIYSDSTLSMVFNSSQYVFVMKFNYIISQFLTMEFILAKGF